MKRVWVVACTLVVSGFGCADGQLTDIDVDGRTADLMALSEWIAGEASFNEMGRAGADARVQELLSADAPETRAGFFLEVASVVGMADNGHSNVWSAPVFDFGVLPLRTYWFSDGLYVVRARNEHADLVGARVDAIGGRTPSELVEAFAPYHGGTDGHFKQYFSNPWLISPALLHAVGVSNEEDRVTLSLTLPDGATRDVELETDRSGQEPARTSPWVRLLPTELIGEGGAWSHPQLASQEWPLAFREPNVPFRYLFMADDDIAYIQLRSNIDQNGVSIRDFASDVEEWLERDKPTSIILDNRFNGGGDLTRTADLALDLPTMIPPQGSVYVLTSNATFSAGIYTSFYPKATDPHRTFIVGEHVGDRTRFFAESRGAFFLPDSRYGIGQSLEMHDIGVGCPDRDVCHLAGRGRMNIAVGSLDPDVEIATTFSDYVAGRDAVLEYALQSARR